MISFKEYFLCEVKASRSNIELFKKKYGGSIEYNDQLAQYGAEDGGDENEFIEDMINSFNDQVKRGTLKQKDIFSFDDFYHISNAIENARNMMSGSELKRIEKEGATRVFENDKVQVVHPKTHQASCHYGAGSKWCTAAKSPEHFNQYTNKEGVVLLYFLPKAGFKGPEFTVRQTKDDPATIDWIIMHYPDSFEWHGSQESRAIGKYIWAAYQHGRPSESLDTIARWSEENASAVEMTRQNVKRLIKAWNISGWKVVQDVFGSYTEENARQETEEGFAVQGALDQGLTGMLSSTWSDIEPHEGQGEPTDSWSMVNSVIEILNRGAHGAALHQPTSDRRWDKVAVAVYAFGTDSEINDLEGMGFGPYAAEGYLANDESIEVDTVLNAFGVTPQDVAKMNEYVTKFSTDKLWEDKDPNKVFGYMERRENQTPENIKKADTFYLNDEDAMFSAGAWNYGSDIRGNVGLGRIGSLAGADTATKKPWKELEEVFIKRLDQLVGQEKTVKELMIKKQTWDGNREIAAQLEKEHGSSVGAPEPAEWVNNQFKEWYDQNQKSNRFLGLGTGLLGYLFKVKMYNWPELEKRILDPKYYHTGLAKLGPDWIQHGRGGDRWEEFEETLFEMWKYTTDNPFKNQKDWDIASALPSQQGGSTPHWERERAKMNIADHMNLYGDVEDVIQLVKATKRALGGGVGGSEEIAWREAQDAWWNRPEIVALYWGGEGAIVKKQKPSEKRRGKDATKWFVTDKMVPRPFYHEVKPGAWLEGIPDIFTISTGHVDKQYVGQFNPGEPSTGLYMQ
tara:strand:+ start:2218 stop:4599 length:2382 start_codon:yes stop_codon:yes gene_type:complete